MLDPDRPVVLAAIAGAHGLDGAVRIKLFGEDAAALQAYRHFNGGTLTLASIKPVKGGAIAHFVQIGDRMAAERARGTTLCVPRSALPPLSEGEYYHHDLIGLAVLAPDGTRVGTVVQVDNFGAGDILDIERSPEADPEPGPDADADADGAPGTKPRPAKRFMVPMTPSAVPAWTDAGLTVDAAWLE